MSTITAAQRLPDELLLEIFRSAVYTPRELSRLALVSKRYLDSVRKLLYDTVYLDLLQEEAPPQGATGYVLDFPTPDLLETLESCPHLAALVCHVECWIHPEMESSEDEDPEDQWLKSSNEGEGTTFNTALESILRLTPNVTALTFGEGFYVQEDWEEFVRKYTPNLRRIQACYISPRELKEVSETLEFLRVWQFDLSDENALEPITLPKLTHLDIDCERLERTDIEFLDSVFSNLRVLKVNIEIAATLDFSRMPHLEYLHLYNVSYQGRQPPNREVQNRRASSLWKSLQLSPSLQTLSLESFRYNDEWEENLFSSLQPEESIPTLISLRFTDKWPLDRIARILDKKLSSTLRRIVLNSYRWEDSFSMRRLEAVKALCSLEHEQIEVVFADPVEPIWLPMTFI
ncbi:hypothetical protein JCM3765_002445 [Sporobolomyces pararoseus]